MRERKGQVSLGSQKLRGWFSSLQYHVLVGNFKEFENSQFEPEGTFFREVG